MNILQVSMHLIVSFLGGKPSEEIYGLSKALVERGHKVTIFTTNIYNKPPKLEPRSRTLTMDDIKIYEFSNLGGRLADKYHLYIPPAMIPAMARQITEFDIIHLHQYPTFLNIVAYHYARKYHVPYLLQAHGSLPGINSNRALRRAYDFLWGRKILEDARKLIAETTMEAEQYRNTGAADSKIGIIPTGIDPSEFDSLPERGGFRRKHGLDNDQRLILYLGRIHQIKGLDLLARAFADLSQMVNNVKLVIVGPDGGYLPSLKKLITELKIGDKVLLSDALYGREKLGAYIDADVYVLPSYYDTLPKTVLEACACGTPVVVTDRCGIADVVNGQAGLVVPYDKDQLRDTLLRLLDDEKMRRQLGEKAKLLVRERFDWKKIAEQVENVYQGIIDT